MQHINTADQTSKKQPNRSYSAATIKVLFALSGNQCAHPDCTHNIVAAGTEFSDAKVIGHIAHIYAHSDGGPRSKPGMTTAERNSPSNLLLLCPTHHVVVDAQHETYPAATLLEWKSKHELRFSGNVTKTIASLGFAELEVAAKALQVAKPATTAASLQQIPVNNKMDKNGFGPSVALLVQMGAAKSQECEEVIRQAAQLDPQFPDRLREGFVDIYSTLVGKGFAGDDLFLQMYDWAGGGDGAGSPRQLAGLCILTHLFIVCDVFEK